ncbi:fatty acyl-CoA synthetase [Rhodococcus sp. IEGM 1307]|uniref:fatty acyl-CoA synthetase n=1 Tax=Rhodococcus sp. IEGM 1307 TaxID=3047091 RepID=UPI0024B75BC0|nr:fatty acyl-CoA synthetase [Rhodococcus sp. IEGM 1307]MDI9973357.1 fatty acyl-CoA synthetase [Rhodococcus sp. IEGM 1307]
MIRTPPASLIDTPVRQARRQSVGDLLRRTALRYPDKIAVITAQRRVTFRQFDEAVNRCANNLTAKGLRKGDRFAIVSHNCWEFAVLAFATARLGVVLVPVNFMLNAEEIAFVLAHSGARAVAVEDVLVPTVELALTLAEVSDALCGSITLSDGQPSGPWELVDAWIDQGDNTAPDVSVDDEDPIRLMYTSGTESRPKGVVLSSRSLISQYVSCAIDGGMSVDDVELHSLPMYHCAQLDCFFSVDVYLGATSIILPSPDPVELLATIEREKVTKLFCPPTVWISLLRHPDFETRDLSSLRKGYYGASPMPAEVLKELSSRLPDVALWNLYGQTEMSPVAAILGPNEQLSHAGSAGRAALNVETRVVDNNDVELPSGQVGEIVHRSPHATLGYYLDQDKTDAAFVNGWFHSGDLGHIDEDGFLTVVDRKKDMIKTGGENVASREIEEALYLLDGVAEAAVFGVSHPYWVEAVVAVVVPRSGSALTPEAVTAHTAQTLAGFKRPKYVILTDSLPKNPSGKILKKELRLLYADLGQQDLT